MYQPSDVLTSCEDVQFVALACTAFVRQAHDTSLQYIFKWKNKPNLAAAFYAWRFKKLESSPAAQDFQHYNFQAVNCKAVILRV